MTNMEFKEYKAWGVFSRRIYFLDQKAGDRVAIQKKSTAIFGFFLGLLFMVIFLSDRALALKGMGWMILGYIFLIFISKIVVLSTIKSVRDVDFSWGRVLFYGTGQSYGVFLRVIGSSFILLICCAAIAMSTDEYGLTPHIFGFLMFVPFAGFVLKLFLKIFSRGRIEKYEGRK